MIFSFLKRISIAVIAMLFSFSIYADDAAKPSEKSFQDLCTEEWMKNANEAKDKVDFKNFGEKYCGCAAGQPLGTKEALQKAVKLCMSRTLLHDAMDTLEDEVGLSKAKESDIADYCHDRWDLILPKPTEADKKLTTAYCECAKPKLMDLLKKSDSMTDKEYDEAINVIAAACSDNAVATEPTPAQ